MRLIRNLAFLAMAAPIWTSGLAAQTMYVCRTKTTTTTYYWHDDFGYYETSVSVTTKECFPLNES